MSGIVVPVEAEINFFKYLLNVLSPDDAVLRLYQNDVTLSRSTVIGDFTEPTDPGYAPITLTSTGWSFAEVGTTGVVEAEYADQIFTLTGEQDIYGYFVTNSAGTLLLWAQPGECVGRFTSGGTYVVSPKFTAKSVY